REDGGLQDGARDDNNPDNMHVLNLKPSRKRERPGAACVAVLRVAVSGSAISAENCPIQDDPEAAVDSSTRRS
ncbi:MAG: hypothetical protein ACRD3O_15430, partial [Terriglobia bacterium]